MVGGALGLVALLGGWGARAQESVLGSVSTSFGSFESTVELKVPAFQGVEPRLALRYDSSGDSGLVGVGWELSELSYIERTSSGSGAPRYDSTDTYRLEGQGLVSSTAMGGTHARKVQSYERIRFNSSTNTWTVTEKNGTVHTYNPLLTTWRGTFRWARSSVRDTRGLAASYTYWCDGQNDCYPDTLAYNGTTIRFHREPRPDVSTFATGAGLGRTQYRLRSIDVQVNGSRARAYALSYTDSPSTGRSLLTSVQEYGRDAALGAEGQVLSGTSLPPMTFTYGQPAARGAFSASAQQQTPLPRDYWNIDVFSPRWLSGDINGDARSDWMGYIIHEPDSLASTRHIVLYTATTQPNGSLTYNTVHTAWAWQSNFVSKHAYSGDFNGDGRDDFLTVQFIPANTFANFEHTIFYVGLSDGMGGFTLSAQETDLGWNDEQQTFVVDVNRDGRDDLLFAQKHGAHNKLTTDHLSLYSLISQGNGTFTQVASDVAMPWGDRKTLAPGDFDGDGATDIMVANFDEQSRGWSLSTFSGSTSGTFSLVRTEPVDAGGRCGCWWGPQFFGGYGRVCGPDNFSSNKEYFRWTVGDVNADGKSDFMLACVHRGDEDMDVVKLGYEHAAFYSAVSDGSGSYVFQQEAETDWRSSLYIVHQSFTGDSDGDGRTEFLFAQNHTGVTLHSVTPRGMANGAALSTQYTPLQGGYSQWTGGDVNSDGRTDFMAYSASSEYALVTATASGPHPDLLLGVSNGLGGQSSVTYVPSSTWPGASGVPPVTPTVSQLQVSDGRGTSFTRTYSYSGLLALANGTVLGFRTARESLNTAGDDLLTTYRQTLASLGQVESVEYRNSSNQAYTYTTYTYTESTTAPFTSLLEQEWNYQCGGTTSCRRTQVRYYHDTYGNLTRKEESGDADVSGDERTTALTYVLNTSAYIVDTPATTALHVGIGTAGTVAARQELYYDGSTRLTTAPTVGNRTRVGEWNNKTNAFLYTQYAYDSAGNITSVTDPLSRVVETSTWDSTYLTFRTRLCNGLNQCTQFTFDPVIGEVLSVTDANGAQHSYGFDALGRETHELRPDGSSLTYHHHDVGNPNQQRVLASLSDGTLDGLWTESYYDGLGRAYLEVKEGLTARQVQYSDDSERPWRESDWHAFNETPTFTEYVYDGMGRAVTERYADGAQQVIHYGRDSTRYVHASGAERTVVVDAYGRPTQVRELQGGSLQTLSYVYNVQDMPTQVTDATGRVTTQEWDSLRRRLSMTDPDRGTTTYTYDSAGRLASTRDSRLQTLTRAYDAADRLLSESGTGWQLNLGYDQTGRGASVGRLTTVTYPEGSLSFSYDSSGRATGVTRCVNGTCLGNGYTYDPAGRVQTLTYPDGEVVTYGYDSLGRTVSLAGSSVYVSSAEYDAANRLLGVSYGNDTRVTYPREVLRKRLSGVQVAGPNEAPLLQASYQYDVGGRMVSISSTTHAAMNLGFSYDSLHRLTDVTGARNTTYTYGPAGNLLSNSDVGTYAYADTAHPQAVTSAGGNTYTHDAMGNMLSGAGRSLTWDVNNRLSSATRGGVSTTFAHGFNGERIRKGSRRYFGSTAELLPNGQLVKYYLLDEQRVARREAAGPTWYHIDHLGSVRMMTNASGVAVAEYDYDAYGRTVSSASAVDNEWNWAGHRLDAETGLVYMQARYYEPSLGRFISADSLIPDSSNPQAYNRYAYGYNNPVAYVDPDGHIPSAVQCGIGGINCGYPQSKASKYKKNREQLEKLRRRLGRQTRERYENAWWNRKWKRIPQMPDDHRLSAFANDLNRMRYVAQTTMEQANRLGLRVKDPRVNNVLGLLGANMKNRRAQDFLNGDTPWRTLVCDEQASLLASQLLQQRWNLPVQIRVEGIDNVHAWTVVEFPTLKKAYQMDMWTGQVEPASTPTREFSGTNFNKDAYNGERQMYQHMKPARPPRVSP